MIQARVLIFSSGHVHSKKNSQCLLGLTKRCGPYFSDCAFIVRKLILFYQLAFVQNFKFEPKHIEYLKTIMSTCDAGFFTFLAELDCKVFPRLRSLDGHDRFPCNHIHRGASFLFLSVQDVEIWAPAEGSVVFPREPLMRLTGPLGICQLLETPLLNLINYATLVATNAARIR